MGGRASSGGNSKGNNITATIARIMISCYIKAMEQLYHCINLPQEQYIGTNKGSYMEKDELMKCACCGFQTLKNYYDICDVCGWQQDDIQEEDPDFKGGANSQSLNEYRTKWLKEHHRET
ncbi:hypothetical protein FACS1894125_0710 [Actinomycetota bacterium]|nr:hypothetical protein FACS1894125_0710 [Actinomycetota bacterium]